MTNIQIEIENNQVLTVSKDCGHWDGDCFYPEYDHYIYYETEPSEDEWKLFFSSVCCQDDEIWTVEAIKKYLRTEEHRQKLYELDLSLEEILNGRYNAKQSKGVDEIYAEWNNKLGFRAFGA